MRASGSLASSQRCEAAVRRAARRFDEFSGNDSPRSADTWSLVSKTVYRREYCELALCFQHCNQGTYKVQMPCFMVYVTLQPSWAVW